ncbi:MAG TPA: glycoside hydrolase family 28 protein [Opitutaceae bacterium]|nr:glycoside hydrolase family 28 protein [Opitutaceae bacterium]
MITLLRPAVPALLASLLLASCASPGTPASRPASAAEPVPTWSTADAIVARVHAPTFPDRTFAITDYGAVADGRTDATAAIGRAIEACHAAGGGHVVVPAGTFLTGAIHLLSNVDLHVADGATLRFSTDPAAYLPVVRSRWEGTECMNYSAFIYAFEQENIAVTGTGTLDGSASDDNWWGWARKGADGKSRATPDVKSLNDLADRGVPVAERVFGGGHYLRPNFFQPYRCRNVLIEGVHIRRSPMWEVNPVLCTNVTVRNVDISTRGPNNDGCDPDSSKDVLIEGCTFETGDDCIAIKSGRNDDGRRVGVAAENLVIRNCTMKDGHGGVVIGSEVAGGCRNVFVENCRMDSPNLERALRFKSNARRGGVIENVFARNITIGRVAEAIITVDFMYEEGPNGKFKPVVRNVQLDHMTAASTPRIFYIASFPGAVVDDIKLSHCTFAGLDSPEYIQNAGRIELNDVTVTPKTIPASLSSRPPQGG